MKYMEFPPNLSLSRDLQCLWMSNGAGNHLIIPDGCLDILFQFSEGTVFSSILVGAMTRHFWVPEQNVQMLA